jgi:hypothetical protein
MSKTNGSVPVTDQSTAAELVSKLVARQLPAKTIERLHALVSEVERANAGPSTLVLDAALRNLTNHVVGMSRGAALRKAAIRREVAGR